VSSDVWWGGRRVGAASKVHHSHQINFVVAGIEKHRITSSGSNRNNITTTTTTTTTAAAAATKLGFRISPRVEAQPALGEVTDMVLLGGVW